MVSPFGLVTAIVYGLIGGFVAIVLQLIYFAVTLPHPTQLGPQTVVDLHPIGAGLLHVVVGYLVGARVVRETGSRFVLAPAAAITALLSTAGRYQVLALRIQAGSLLPDRVANELFTYLVIALGCLIVGTLFAARGGPTVRHDRQLGE